MHDNDNACAAVAAAKSRRVRHRASAAYRGMKIGRTRISSRSTSCARLNAGGRAAFSATSLSILRVRSLLQPCLSSGQRSAHAQSYVARVSHASPAHADTPQVAHARFNSTVPPPPPPPSPKASSTNWSLYLAGAGA